MTITAASGSSYERRVMLGLPTCVTACPFDLDRVPTQAARVHAASCKEMFDGYLRDRAAATSEPFVGFDPVDCDEYVDGKPRYDRVRSSLASRGVELAQGSRRDPPGAETIDGLGNPNNALMLQTIHGHDVPAYEGSVRHVQAAFGDALAGVAAGRARGFGCVVGVDRAGEADPLRGHKATIVVADLSELLGAP
jgi:beta-phosphoglucomutase-like phosphatase (HAD superfamily)